MPDYLQSLQKQLDETSSLLLSASVHGTVTTYDESIEINRKDQGFWDGIYGPLNLTGQPGPIYDRINVGDLASNRSISLLNADYNWDQYNAAIDNSWSIISFVHNLAENHTAEFESNALLFNTKRRACQAEWLLTFDSVKLLRGGCDLSSLPNQDVFIKYQAAFRPYYANTLMSS